MKKLFLLLLLAVPAALALLVSLPRPSPAFAAGPSATKATAVQVADFWARIFNGPPPYGVPPLNATRTNQRTANNVVLWDVSFDSYRDPDTDQPVRLHGILSVPNKPGRTFPGLVVTHSVGAPYPAPDNVEEMAIYFAQQGYVTLAFYFRGYGTSRMKKLSPDSAPGQMAMGNFYCANLVDDPKEPLDNVWAGLPVDMFQAGEFLAAQPEVTDPNGLAFIGHSGGGYAALAAGIFSKRFKVLVASAPAATTPDPDRWMEYWKNSSWHQWAATQPDPKLAMAQITRTWSYTGIYPALNNPHLVAKNPNWKLKNTAVLFYAGEKDVAVPARDIEAAYRLADSSNQKAFHWSPTGGHGGPESWERCKAWLAGHYPGRPQKPPKADLKVVSRRGRTVTFSGAGSSDDDTLISWEYDFGDRTAQNWGDSISHTYAAPGTYKATLTVTDGAGLRDSASVRVVITRQESDSAPAADRSQPEKSPGQPEPSGAPAGPPVLITVEQTAGEPGDTVSVPIVVSGPPKPPLTSVTLTVGFDPAVLTQPQVVRGPLIPGPAWWNFGATSSAPGTQVITAEQFVPPPTPVRNGVVARIAFTIGKSASPGVYALSITNVQLNNGTVRPNIQAGIVRVDARRATGANK